MSERRYDVLVGALPQMFACVAIKMYEDSTLIGVNHAIKSVSSPYLEYILEQHIYAWEFCYEKFLVIVRQGPGGPVIDQFYLEVTVNEGIQSPPPQNVTLRLHHQHLNVQPPPPPPEAGPAPPPPFRPTPPEGPEGPPVERPFEPPVEVQPPDEPPKPLPPYQPPKPPDHPPFQPPPPIPERPPRFSPRETDTQTFLRFLERWGHQIDEYTINVPLDAGLWVEQLEEPWRSLWAKLTEHKADLVFKRKGQLYVAEVKPRLSRGAIGEALIAAQMYEMIYKPAQKPQPAVICMTASPILLQMAAHNGVLVFVTDSIDGAKLWGEVRTRRKVR